MAATKKTSARKKKTAKKTALPKKEYQRRMKPPEIETFFAALQADNPEPKGELDYVNAYTLLVAVVLSAQATDVGVNKATGPLFKKVKTP